MAEAVAITPSRAEIRVLVADDSDVDRLILSTIVRKEGFSVIKAIDGVDAVEKFQALRPHMVLLDAVMPRMDGFEAAQRIKQMSGEDFVPIIFLTSLTAADELARCLEAGGDDFLSKPYNNVILRAKLGALERMRQMHATMQGQRDQIAQNNAHLVHEQEAAKAVFDNVAHSGALSDSNIRHLISPLAVFNGDVLLAARNPGGGLYVLLGDFTGHGLTAAIGALPLAEIFYGMSQKGFLLQDIVRECNLKLKKMLPPGYFCCATLADFNYRKHTLELWNGGLPIAWVVRTKGAIERLASTHLPLGILETSAFDDSTQVVNMQRGDRLLMCTDGLLEARDGDGRMFGDHGFQRIVETSDNLFDDMASRAEHIGGDGPDDDITIVEVTMVDERELADMALDYEESEQTRPRDWSFSYQLGPESLKTSNPLPLLQHVLMEVPEFRQQGSAIYTVLAELFSNALEHGVLGLDSSMKSTATGYADYYGRRADALEALKDGFVRFELRSSSEPDGDYLTIRVIDSGPGFNYGQRQGRDVEYHGRGLPLIERLCTELRILPATPGQGNQVEAVFGWRREHGR